MLARFAPASASRDYATICSQLLSTVLVRGLTQAGLPCETALATGLRDVRSPRLAVLGVTVNGATASARVHTSATNQAPADASLKLVKQQATWRISSLVPVAAARAHSGHQ